MSHSDQYMPGYAPRIVAFMKQRSAETHAGFFLPFLKPGMRLLDCACGPGTITTGLAARVAPGETVGVDLEESQIQIAKDAKNNPPNLRYMRANVYQLPFPDGHFDAVFSHALFEHVAEPVKAAREIRRVLKPGGVAGLCSPDWDGFIFAPPDAEVQSAAALFRRIQESDGGNTTAGRRLGVWMDEAGFKDIRMSAHYECQEDLSDMGEFLYDRLERSPKSDDVFGRGWTEPNSLARMLAALRDWEKRPDGLFGLAWLSATARA